MEQKRSRINPAWQKLEELYQFYYEFVVKYLRDSISCERFGGDSADWNIWSNVFECIIYLWVEYEIAEVVNSFDRQLYFIIILLLLVYAADDR